MDRQQKINNLLTSIPAVNELYKNIRQRIINSGKDERLHCHFCKRYYSEGCHYVHIVHNKYGRKLCYSHSSCFENCRIHLKHMELLNKIREFDENFKCYPECLVCKPCSNRRCTHCEGGGKAEKINRIPNKDIDRKLATHYIDHENNKQAADIFVLIVMAGDNYYLS